LLHIDAVDGSVRFPDHLQVGDFVEVWPHEYRPLAARRPPAEDIDKLDAKKRKPSTKAQGKIIYQAPGTAMRVQVFEAAVDFGSSDEDDVPDIPPDDGDQPRDGGDGWPYEPGVGGGVVDIDPGPSVDDDGGLAPGGGGPGSGGPSPGDEGPSDGEPDTVDPVPHLPPPPAVGVAPVDVPAADRARRYILWHGFKLAPIWSAGIQSGWGATCARHRNAADLPKSTACKKQVGYGRHARAVDDATCLRLAKTWILLGEFEELRPAFARTDHVQIDPRDHPAMSDDELEALSPALVH
jgi:hypothetical protein